MSTATLVEPRSESARPVWDGAARLAHRIAARRAQIGVVGLGYVGLPLALELAAAGFSVTGIDVDAERIVALREGRSYVTDVADGQITDALNSRRLSLGADVNAVSPLDAVIICVPTPLRKTKDPDLSYVISAVEAVAQGLRRGQLVVLESTTYPGTTEELVLPKLSGNFLRAGEDFFLAYSSERVDPGNRRYATRNIPKVVAGVTPRCADLAAALYRAFVREVVVVSSPKVAEMSKLLENTFRSVNIALVNEIAMLCAHLKIDVWEVIRAASTKPFGFMPFYPGPGLGGHCIPVDPLYLAWKARSDGFEPRFIGLADRINSAMPHVVLHRTMELLNDHGKALRGSRVHLLGVAYKADVGDIRESPALEIIRLLLERGAKVSYSDPFVPRLAVKNRRLAATDATPDTLSRCDVALIVTAHSGFDYQAIVRDAPLVFDTRNATAGIPAANVVKL